MDDVFSGSLESLPLVLAAFYTVIAVLACRLMRQGSVRLMPLPRLAGAVLLPVRPAGLTRSAMDRPAGRWLVRTLRRQASDDPSDAQLRIGRAAHGLRATISYGVKAFALTAERPSTNPADLAKAFDVSAVSCRV